MASPTIFYAWQSDTPSKGNRAFIQKAAEAALKRIGLDMPVEKSPRLDHDTKGEGGMVQIAETVFRKIDRCTAILADITLVGSIARQEGAPKRTPNPNVLLELGYAARSRGWERIIAVMNTAFGEPEALPFDIKHRKWPVRFELGPNGDGEPQIRQQLSREIERAIRDVLATSVEKVGRPEREVLDLREEFHQRIRGNRFGEIDATDGVQAVMVVPMDYGSRRLDVSSLRPTLAKMAPIGAGGWNNRIGGRFFRTFQNSDTGQVLAAAEIDERGMIMSATRDAYTHYEARPGVLGLPGGDIVRKPAEALLEYVTLLGQLGFVGPFYLDVSLIRLRPTVLYTAMQTPSSIVSAREADIVPDLLIWKPDQPGDLVFQNVAKALRPAFDFLWREFGFERCSAFDESGEWIGFH